MISFIPNTAAIVWLDNEYIAVILNDGGATTPNEYNNLVKEIVIDHLACDSVQINKEWFFNIQDGDEKCDIDITVDNCDDYTIELTTVTTY